MLQLLLRETLKRFCCCWVFKKAIRRTFERGVRQNLGDGMKNLAVVLMRVLRFWR